MTDRAWARIEPLLPASGRGGQWRDHRQVMNAILFKLRIGAPWRDLPERYGPRKTARERLRKWTMDGTWQKILDEAVVKDDAVGEVERILSVDSTGSGPASMLRVPEKGGCGPTVEAIAVESEGIWRSRGGLGSKIHLAVDRRPMPLSLILTPRQDGDNPQLLPAFGRNPCPALAAGALRGPGRRRF